MSDAYIRNNVNVAALHLVSIDNLVLYVKVRNAGVATTLLTLLRIIIGKTATCSWVSVSTRVIPPTKTKINIEYSDKNDKAPTYDPL